MQGEELFRPAGSANGTEQSLEEALGAAGISAAMEKYRAHVGLDMTSAPVITFRPQADGGKTMILMTKFLKFARSFA